MAKKSNTLTDLTKFLEFENVQLSGGSVMKSEDEFFTKKAVSFVDVTAKSAVKEAKVKSEKIVKEVNEKSTSSSVDTTMKDLYLTAVEPFDQFGLMKLTIEFQTSVFNSWLDFQRKLWLNK